MLRARLPLLAALLLVAAAAAAWVGGRGRPGGDGPVLRAAPVAQAKDNPCLDPALGPQLRCPDLIMRRPFGMRTERTRRGRVLLRAGNAIDSVGDGPAELRGARAGTRGRWMDAEQVIHRHDGGVLRVRTGARLEFKLAHLHRRWWKMHDAARFELWRLADDGTPRERVRVGPKVAYCLRDLERNHGTLPLSPRRAVYPACSTSARRTHVTLGTSVGWSDVYPPDYPEQWIDVTGLRGCFAYVHTADPTDAIRERDETNNQAQVVVRLPFRARDPRGGCAGRQFGVRYRGAGGVGVW